MANQDIAAAVRTLAAAIAEQITSAMRSQSQGGAAERRSDGRQGAGGAADREVLAIAVRAVQLYAEMHPRPTQVTIGQAAEMLGIGRWKATQLAKVGVLRLNPCGLVPIEVVDQARALNERQKNEARTRRGSS